MPCYTFCCPLCGIISPKQKILVILCKETVGSDAILHSLFRTIRKGDRIMDYTHTQNIHHHILKDRCKPSHFYNCQHPLTVAMRWLCRHAEPKPRATRALQQGQSIDPLHHTLYCCNSSRQWTLHTLRRQLPALTLLHTRCDSSMLFSSTIQTHGEKKYYSPSPKRRVSGQVIIVHHMVHMPCTNPVKNTPVKLP